MVLIYYGSGGIRGSGTMNRLYDPCYFCQERKIGCHGNCDRYKLSCELKDKDKQKRAKIALERDVASNGWCYDKRGKKI